MTNPTTTTFVLGASDPEMAAIEAAVTAMGGTVVYATQPSGPFAGERVRGASAYKGCAALISTNTTCVVLVECSPDLGSYKGEVVIVDHHRPGDPGYGRPPSEYWEASSLGQVFRLLDLTPLRVELLFAAADHCLGAAYAGQCPDVNPSRLRGARIVQRADFLLSLPEGHFLRREVAPNPDVTDPKTAMVDAVEAAIEASITSIKQAETITLGGEIADMRSVGTLPMLPEASAISGTPVLYRMPGRRGQPDKVGILGAGEGTVAGPDPIEAFLRGEGPAEDLSGIYGDSARGFAGGYVQ